MSQVHGPALPGISEQSVPRPAARPPLGLPAWLEALGVALSPAIAALVLRLRLMAPITIEQATGDILSEESTHVQH